MKKSVLKYGFISGGMSAVMVSIVGYMMHSYKFDAGEVMGYSFIILSFIPIYLGMVHYKNHAATPPSFLKYLGAGLLIAVISSACYALIWEILYYTLFPDFIEKYVACMADKWQQEHRSAEYIKKAMAGMEFYKKMYKNPISLFLGTLILEPLPVGIVISLISSAIVYFRNRNKK
jgi:hypothetical protein